MSEQDTDPPKEHKVRLPGQLRGRHRYSVLATVVLALGVLAALLARQAAADFSRPLGDPLPTPDRAALPLVHSDRASVAANSEDHTPGNATPSRPECDGPPEMILLLVGADTTTTDTIRGLADTIRVARFDFVTPSISVLAVPRALWVSTPSLAAYDDRLQAYFGEALDPDGEPLSESGPHSMLSSSYFYGNLYELPGGSGLGVLAEALYVNLGVPVDHYAAVNMKIMAEMVDAIGGVDVNVPYPVGGFSAGLHHMRGEEVLRYARTRLEDNDWYRVDRQNIVLRAVWDKMVEPGSLAQLPPLIDRFMDDIQTDLSKAQIASLVCLMTRVDQEDARYFSLSPEVVTVSSTRRGFFILLPEEDKIAPIIEGFLVSE